MTLGQQILKLRAMTASEMGHRLRYRHFLARERRAYLDGSLHDPDRLKTSLKAGLRGVGWEDKVLQSRRSPQRRFYPAILEREAIQSIVASEYRAELEKSREIAALARRHELAFFGQVFELGPDIDWHADPVFRKQWPKVFHSDVPVSGGDRGFGDVKFVWEVNRHQFFVDLAKMAFLEATTEDAAHVHDLHSNWMEAAPYGMGAPWACALEPAFRVFSWLWAYYLLLGSGHMADEDHIRWLLGFRDHGHFLARHLERWSSPYNHLAGEASALYQLGLLFPEFEEAERWRSVGRDLLERGLSWQFHADGGSTEQSTFYHHATLAFYLTAVWLGRLNGEDFSPRTWAAIEHALEFSMHICWPDGRVPSIGGGDDGKPVRMEHLPLWDFRPYQALGAVLFQRGDFRFHAGRFWEDALWLLGTDGRARFEAIEPRAPLTRTAFAVSGYVVTRSEWSPSGDYLCFDCGPQAAGLRRDGVPSAAHGHADCLSIIVAFAGRRVLVDPGFYCYNCSNGSEVHFRRTHVHNTLAIDGRDQARHVSKMAWTHTYEARLDEVGLDGSSVYLKGRHDGYARGHTPVVHVRHVLLSIPGIVIVADELVGSPGCEFLVNFQFAPGKLEQHDDRVVRFDDRFDLAWWSPDPTTASLQVGGELPEGGWIADSLGVKRPSPRLRVDGRFEHAPLVLVAVLTDTRRAEAGASYVRRLNQAPEWPSQDSVETRAWLECLARPSVGVRS